MEYYKAVEGFRDIEYPMMGDNVYLDHGGTTIYARSLIVQFSASMITNLYGNPHSASAPAHLSGQEVDRVREKALRFFGADPQFFDLVFTANATAAIKLVAESFQDLASVSSESRTFWYGYHKDAHTSIVGVRELTNGSFHCFGSDEEVEEWLADGCVANSKSQNETGLPGLFAYPGQSNMTGRRLPLSWTKTLRKSKKAAHQDTYSLLDAAALATSAQIDLSNPDSAPDFMAVSFYKIFGFPDLGALIVRKESGHILSWRKYFGGGTVNQVTVLHESTVSRKDSSIHDSLEDGTLPFHNIIALGCAIDVHNRLYGSMATISKHTSFLSHRMYAGMSTLYHPNGRPVCVMYNDVPEGSTYGDSKTQGATIAFNITGSDGRYIGHSLIETLANNQRIFLRSGGLCNSGGITSYLKVQPWQFKRAWSAGYRCGSEDGSLEVINGKPTGVVRASLGAMSTIKDVDALLSFLSSTFVGKVTKDLALTKNIEKTGDVDSGEDIGLVGVILDGGSVLRTDSGFASIAESDDESVDFSRGGGPRRLKAPRQNPREAVRKSRSLSLSDGGSIAESMAPVRMTTASHAPPTSPTLHSTYTSPSVPSIPRRKGLKHIYQPLASATSMVELTRPGSQASGMEARKKNKFLQLFKIRRLSAETLEEYRENK